MSMPRISNRVRRAALALAAALTLVAAGCSEPFTAYHVPGNREYVAEGRKILVMPFMDTRTFVDKDDNHRVDLGAHARSIFVSAMRDYNAGAGASILTPAMPQPVKSLTNAEVADIGRRYGADVVVAGQVFSFTGTRAASIPPRAGMFVRVISAHDGALLFVGDHYQAASLPGASGGRELQARNVSDRLVEGLLSKARPAATAMLGVASSTAMAMLSPVPVGYGAPSGNKAGRERTAGADPHPLPPPGPALPGLAGGSALNPDEWDEQIVPEVPPLLDFGEDFYNLPAIAAETAPEASAFGVNGGGEPALEPVDAKDVAGASNVAPDAKEEAAPATEVESHAEQIAEHPAPIDAGTDVSGERRNAVAESAVMEAPEPVAEAAPGTAANDAVEAVPAATDMGEPASVIPVAEPSYVASQPPESYIVDHVDSAAAAVIDELAEIDFRNVNPNMISVDAPPPVATASKLSGDELAEDLFADGGQPAGETAPRPRSPASRNGQRATRTNATAIAATPTTGTVAPAIVAAPPAAISADYAMGGEYDAFELDPDTLEVVTPAWRRAAVNAPAPAARAPEDAMSAAQAKPATRPSPRSVAGSANPSLPAADAEERIVSTPLAVEQPHTVKSVREDHAEDPDAAKQDGLALVAVPARGTPEGIRVLILPYHDRPNSNNLIANTGGGEVVTTLFGTQLAGDPGITLLWDGSGQATHDRLVSREEAISMGRLADADYVMRGQVVEFRRAQSVPSFYSAVISTAVLAAQIFFAEMSGVDVATEVYRVSDGLCVMSRRDRSQQKYVVQAEKTVRRMAAAMAEGVGAVVRESGPEGMDPLIDELTPVTMLSNPR